MDLPIPLTARSVSRLRSINISKLPEWQNDMITGLIHLRDGEDYIDNGGRYEKAYDRLLAAYRGLLRSQHKKNQKSKDNAILARICLWIGISLNENVSILDKVARNIDAIAWYRRGLGYCDNDRDDRNTLITRASLNNSMGVAYHHKNGYPIGAVSFRYYERARELYRQDVNNRELVAIMKKVESNSGHAITRSVKSVKIVERVGGSSTFRSFNVVV